MPARSREEWKWRIVFATTGTLVYWPQMPQMNNVGNTVRVLCGGLLFSGGVLR